MVWTTPRTAETGEIWTASDWNLYVRDNLNETMPALASAALDYFVSDAAHNLAVRTAGSATVATSQTTASTSYVDLTTVGPAVTKTTGTAALVFYSANVANNNASPIEQSRFSCAVSGGTTVAADDDWSACQDGVAANNTNRFGMFHLFTGLAAGVSHTFTMKYRVTAGTSTFLDRHIIVVPF